MQSFLFSSDFCSSVENCTVHGKNLPLLSGFSSYMVETHLHKSILKLESCVLYLLVIKEFLFWWTQMCNNAMNNSRTNSYLMKAFNWFFDSQINYSWFSGFQSIEQICIFYFNEIIPQKWDQRLSKRLWRDVANNDWTAKTWLGQMLP